MSNVSLRASIYALVALHVAVLAGLCALLSHQCLVAGLVAEVQVLVAVTDLVLAAS